MSNKHFGSSIDDFMKEEGCFEESQAQAVTEVAVWQRTQSAKAEGKSDDVEAS